jgi:putative transposase
VRYRNSREVLGTVKNITASNRNGKWLASIQSEREVEQPVAHGDAVGIDMGAARLATLSDGTVFPALNTFKRYAGVFGKAQQAVK